MLRRRSASPSDWNFLLNVLQPACEWCVYTLRCVSAPPWDIPCFVLTVSWIDPGPSTTLCRRSGIEDK